MNNSRVFKSDIWLESGTRFNEILCFGGRQQNIFAV